MDSAREREVAERAAPAPIADALSSEGAPPGPGGALTPGGVVALQRSAGNAAVADMLAADAADAEGGPGIASLQRLVAGTEPGTDGAAPASGVGRGGGAAAGAEGAAASNGAAAPAAAGAESAAASSGPAAPAAAGGLGAAASNGSARTGGGGR